MQPNLLGALFDSSLYPKKNYVLLVPATYCLKTPANMDKLLHGSDML